ncbi:MAG: hypothetical protein OXG47_00755 [bacterium]|nr:hypothetical protein [bacterium]MCY3923901.1 hypothetical protein [bacterium]
MGDWWNALAGDLQVFYLIGIVSGAFLMLQFLLMAIGVGMDFDLDLEGGDSDVGFLSLRSLTAFFFAFGWTGVLMKEGENSTTLSVVVSLIVGLAVFFLVALLWRRFARMTESGSIDYHSAIGVNGTVYIPVAADRSKPGKVEVMVQGRMRVIDAYTTAPTELPAKTRVKVTDVVDPTTVLVEPLV